MVTRPRNWPLDLAILSSSSASESATVKYIPSSRESKTVTRTPTEKNTTSGGATRHMRTNSAGGVISL